MRAACLWLGQGGDAGDFGPNLKGLGLGGSILGGWNLVTAKQEEQEEQEEQLYILLRS